MRTNFDNQLKDLHRELTAMGAMCENAIALSAKAINGGEKPENVTALAVKIDEKERDIEGMCMKLLLQQQPVARDLRVISSALKMVTDMERIGDNSGDIAEIVSLGHITPTHDKLDIDSMARATVKMVTDSIDAFVKGDESLARSVIAYDDVVDGHFNRIKTSLIAALQGGHADGEYALDLLMIAKYFERMADHAANIAGWVIYALTGKKAEGQGAG